MPADERVGPAFDTNTLIRPTQRKLVGVWMDDAKLPTLVLPQVRHELTRGLRADGGFNSAAAWLMAQDSPDAPFKWASLDREQEQRALEMRRMFTQSCFPKTPVDRIETDGDAVAVSEALVLGVDFMVTGDFNTIDHHEVNHFVGQMLGRNAGLLVTLDDALMRAYAGGELADQLLVNALATVAPEPNARWSVDAAFEDLSALEKALQGSHLYETAARLTIRWEHSRDLEQVVERARRTAADSPALRFERRRTGWHQAAAERAGNWQTR